MDITSTTTKRYRARITSQGQITIPKAIRDQLGVKPGDDVEFEAGPGGMVVRPRARISVLELAGIAADITDRIPGTAEELDGLIERAAAEAYAEKEVVARGDRRAAARKGRPGAPMARDGQP